MGDSGLLVYPGIAALAVLVIAMVMTIVAWLIPARPVRVGIGLGLLALGFLGALLSLVAVVLVTGLGVVVVVLGIRTRRADPPDGGIGR